MSEDNVVKFPVNNETLGAENKAKMENDKEETLKKAFAARDNMIKSMVNDMMSLSVQMAAMTTIMTSKLGVTDAEMTNAVKHEIENVYKAMDILNGEGYVRDKLERAKAEDVLFSPHFDALQLIDSAEELKDEEKVALAREYGLIH